MHGSGSALARAAFTNVQYVPDLAVNLLSVSSMTEAGLSVYFKDERCIIYNKDDKIAGVARKVANKLYQFSVRPRPPTAVKVSHVVPANIVTSAESHATAVQRLWHKRLGHVHSAALAQLFDHDMVHNPLNIPER